MTSLWGGTGLVQSYFWIYAGWFFLDLLWFGFFRGKDPLGAPRPLPHTMQGDFAGSPSAPGSPVQAIAVSLRPGALRARVARGKYENTACELLLGQYAAGDVVWMDLFKLDTARIPGWDPSAVVERVLEGPADLPGMWDVRKAVAGFGPQRYTRSDSAVVAINRTSEKEYPSRREVRIKNFQEQYVMTVFMNTDDLRRFFMFIDMPGFREQALLLAFGGPAGGSAADGPAVVAADVAPAVVEEDAQEVVAVARPYVIALARHANSPCELTIAQYEVGDLAETFKLDTAHIPGWDPKALVEKIIDGPEELVGKWIVSKAVAGFGPQRYSKPANAVAAINNTSSEKYRSRTEVDIKNQFVSLVNICTRNS